MSKNKGFGGVPPNMQALMRQAQKMQEDLAKAQAESETFSSEGSAGGGVVKVIANGKDEIISVFISPEVIDPKDPDTLQELVKAATNNALQQVRDNRKKTLGNVTGGLNIPGLF